MGCLQRASLVCVQCVATFFHFPLFLLSRRRSLQSTKYGPMLFIHVVFIPCVYYFQFTNKYRLLDIEQNANCLLGGASRFKKV
jgi:hypothetical protein